MSGSGFRCMTNQSWLRYIRTDTACLGDGDYASGVRVIGLD
jgi:hypothetical protein